MSEYSSICQGCVSQDRKLYHLGGLRTILQEINLTEMSSIKSGGVCWECAGAIMKFYKFKRKVQRTQSLLFSCDKLKDVICGSTLGLKINCGYDYLIEYNVDPLISNTNIKVEDVCLDDNFRQDEKYKLSLNDENLKEEQIISDQCDLKEYIIHDRNHTEDLDLKLNEREDDNMFNSSDEIPLAETKETNENIIDSKKICTKLKTAKKYNKLKRFSNSINTFSKNDDLTKNIVTIVYTEEEMLSKRDKKRNCPNFKVLPYKCESCVLGFKRKDFYDKHFKKKHDKNVGDHACPVCSIRFLTSKKLERHKKKHYVCYRCYFCNYQTTSTMAIQSHCRSKHAADEPDCIHCPHCDIVVKTPQEMSKHKTKEHPLYCDKCGETFVSTESLRSHKRRIHNSKRQFLCTLCNKPFKTKMKLESHTATQHTEIAQKLSYCQLCKIQYKNIYVYRNHLRNSALHSQEAHQCSECKKQFASKVYLKKHYNFYHLQKTQYQCDQCSKPFISDYRLKNHKRTQHGVSSTRDYHCNVCGKQFFTQTTLKGHQQIHSEHRSYMCEDCGDTFKQRPALYNHHRLVHRGSSIRNKNETI